MELNQLHSDSNIYPEVEHSKTKKISELDSVLPLTEERKVKLLPKITPLKIS